MRCDFFDFHPAFGAGDKDRPSAVTIDQNAQIQFFGDIGAFFDQQPTDFPTFRTGLVRHQGLADQFLGQARHVRLVLRNLDATGLASAAGMDLRLHDKHRGIQFCRPCPRLPRGDLISFPRGTGTPNCANNDFA